MTEARRKIEALALLAPQTALLLAELYASQQQYQSAIQQLATWAETQDDPAISRLIATYYLELTEYRKAWRYLQMSLQSAQEQEDIEAQAVALHYMVLILEAFEEYEECGQRAEDAQALYRQIGNLTMIERLDMLIEACTP